jgi:hypothetical protein
MCTLFAWLATSQQYFIFLTEQTRHELPASSTFLSEQINTSHQPNKQGSGLRACALPHQRCQVPIVCRVPTVKSKLCCQLRQLTTKIEQIFKTNR